MAAAIDSQREESVRARPSSDTIPAVTSGNRMCAATTSSLPCDTAAVAVGSNAYAAATSARTQRSTGMPRVATYAASPASGRSPSSSTATTAGTPPAGASTTPSPPSTASAAGAGAAVPPATGCQVAR